MAFLLILILLFSFSSCTPYAEPYKMVEVRLDELHPFEEHGGGSIWYKLRYFDGERVVEKRLDKGSLFFEIRVKGGGLRPISVIPLGVLSPMGGFYEEGMGDTIYLDYETGPFADVMVNAASYRPKVVSEFSFHSLKECGIDANIIDQSDFLEKLYDGELREDNIKFSKIFSLSLTTFPPGYWVSDNPFVPSFTVKRASDPVEFRVFPGVYSFWCKELKVLYVLLLDDDGSLYSSMSTFDPFRL